MADPQKGAQDFAVFGGGGPASAVSAGKSASSSAYDDITEAIRKEILEKQNRAILAKITKDLDEKEQERLNALKERELAKYLNGEGKEKAAKILADKEFAESLRKAEIAGYARVCKDPKFEASFSNPWHDVSADENGTKTTPIKNAAGATVCDLTETTHGKGDNSPDGVEKYRKIHFETELATKTGPLHLMMALQDHEGKNMPADGALYFTAHYDEEGKLTEMSAPAPVQFNGTDDNAIGFIKVGNETYTLPVTQGNYKQMREAVKETSLGVHQSQELAQDGISQLVNGPEQNKTKTKADPQVTSDLNEEQSQEPIVAIKADSSRPLSDKEIEDAKAKGIPVAQAVPASEFGNPYDEFGVAVEGGEQEIPVAQAVPVGDDPDYVSLADNTNKKIDDLKQIGSNPRGPEVISIDEIQGLDQEQIGPSSDGEFVGTSIESISSGGASSERGSEALPEDAGRDSVSSIASEESEFDEMPLDSSPKGREERQKARQEGQSKGPVDKRVMDEVVKELTEVQNEVKYTVDPDKDQKKYIASAIEISKEKHRVMGNLDYGDQSKMILAMKQRENMTPEQQAAPAQGRGASQKRNSELRRSASIQQGTLGNLSASKSPPPQGQASSQRVDSGKGFTIS